MAAAKRVSVYALLVLAVVALHVTGAQEAATGFAPAVVSLKSLALETGAVAPRVLIRVPIFPNPSGGIRVLFTLARALRSNGIDARVWLFKFNQHNGTRIEWLTKAEQEVPEVRGFDDILEDDVFILPDNSAVHSYNGLKNRKVMYIMNHHFVLDSGCCATRPNVDLVMTNCRTSAEIFSRMWGTPVLFVPTSVNMDLYDKAMAPGVEQQWMRRSAKNQKHVRIAYQDRKSGPIMKWFREKLTGSLGIDDTHLTWLPMRSLSESDYIETLQSADIYLVLSTKEGNNLSVLEAMLLGTLVVGYSGEGGLDFMVGAKRKTKRAAAAEGSRYRKQLKVTSGKPDVTHGLAVGTAIADVQDVHAFFTRAMDKVIATNHGDKQPTKEQMERAPVLARPALVRKCRKGKLQNTILVDDGDHWMALGAMARVIRTLQDPRRGHPFYRALRECAYEHAKTYPMPEEANALRMAQMIRHFAAYAPVNPSHRIGKQLYETELLRLSRPAERSSTHTDL